MLLGNDGKNVKTGVPSLSGAKVTGEIVRHGRGDKIIVFKRSAGRTTRGSGAPAGLHRSADQRHHPRLSEAIQWHIRKASAPPATAATRNPKYRGIKKYGGEQRRRRQHHPPPVRHQVAPGQQRRPRHRLHDLRPHRRRREVRAQEQDARTRSASTRRSRRGDDRARNARRSSNDDQEASATPGASVAFVNFAEPQRRRPQPANPCALRCQRQISRFVHQITRSDPMALLDRLRQELDRAGQQASRAFDEGRLRLDLYRAQQSVDRFAQRFGYAVFRAQEGRRRAAAPKSSRAHGQHHGCRGRGDAPRDPGRRGAKSVRIGCSTTVRSASKADKPDGHDAN